MVLDIVYSEYNNLGLRDKNQRIAVRTSMYHVILFLAADERKKGIRDKGVIVWHYKFSSLKCMRIFSSHIRFLFHIRWALSLGIIFI